MNNHAAGTGQNGQNDWNRRDFIKSASSFGALMALMGGIPLQAADSTNAAPGGATSYSTVGAPLNIGVIGCGVWGREILNTLARLPNAPAVAVCDTYQAFLNRGKEAAPKAQAYKDYKELLAQKDVQGVVVATPTPKHREIVEAALKAGKHVYCEAPFATTVEDTQAIAKAAKAAVKLNFQSGLQGRSDPQRHFLLTFIRSGSMGRNVMARSQWHKKESWRRTSPNPEREKELNWRLRKSESLGLIGEIGIHQLDLMSWFINDRPTAVTGFGGILNWNDGRDVADTIQSLFQFPGSVNFSYDCTLASSFDADYDMIYGTDATIMMRGNKAWMFKEPDSPLLGWEVYARKDQFYQETGIALVANATKLVALQKTNEEVAPYTDTPLHFALEAFVKNSNVVATGVEDFVSNFGDTTDGLRDYLAGLSKSRKPAAGYQEGFEATMAVIKANEAITKGQKIEFGKDWFQI
ncbi:Gfo/Idh/MocA family protein [Pedosphaera parvula]|uniref:Oxidoreductase domain protein n=1 Tax=Pedosphaera parvula (strain Ellin514) TaxID=320771 RepID=B9XS65_PEDPL|nr:Gfo/Idh/MocA family oxidoreductase [Pedosphaera parvula]EEF57320.1 oxidoreductase domain protein [Pedosphaera parvula Ellin514]